MEYKGVRYAFRASIVRRCRVAVYLKENEPVERTVRVRVTMRTQPLGR